MDIELVLSLLGCICLLGMLVTGIGVIVEAKMRKRKEQREQQPGSEIEE
jgi:hypothetical protein